MNVGIDLGTTNTVVSYINQFGEWKALQFEQGSTDDPHMLPSCLSVNNGNVRIGQAALSDRLVNADNFLGDTKYYMGDDTKNFDRGGISFTAKSTAVKILEEVMRELKKQFPEETSFNAFVTVPARFLEAARRQTREALVQAGFEDNGSKRSLTDEPVAAAVAYCNQLSNASTVLVVDYGGGTFDLSLVQTNTVGLSGRSQNMSVKSWGGDLHLGGNDVDKLLIEKMLDKFVEDGGRRFDPWAISHQNDEQRAVAIIRSQPLKIKKQLYSNFTAPASVIFPNLLDGINLDFSITPEEYKKMMIEISIRYQKCIEQIFSRIQEPKTKVDKILIVGGMAHEPCLKEVLISMFHDEEKLVIPKESMYLVSKGAAIWNNTFDLHVENKIYSSVGILIRDGKDVFDIVKEGDIIGDKVKSFEGDIDLSRADGTYLILKIVEYNGNFIPSNYNIVKCIKVPITPQSDRRNLLGFFNRNKSNGGIRVEIRMNADKLFNIIIKQQGVADKIIDLRLNI